MRSQLGVLLVLQFSILLIGLFPASVWAGPTFMNRQAYPQQLGLTEVGRFQNNDLKTFEVLTQWNNPSNDKIVISMTFTFFDKDSGDSQLGEDGMDDTLMVVTETMTIPEQVSNWGRYFQLTAIGYKLNQGFDHPEEGAGLELYLDAQITSIQHQPSQ